ncbi:hypothetical protein [Allomuricauda sp. d1]|uniref:hypothetical protein n=1 Tax=Allomuricauda sp. d1 TaxID=3136725 RepID=UPI0031D614CF
MADNAQKTSNSSDEIDLGQLFQMIGNFFNRIFRGFLRFFLYIKKNFFILLGLVILGVAVGFGLKQISSEKMKTEVIVRPNIESKDYLYDVVAEIQANIKAKNRAFFEPLGIDIEKLKGFEAKVESLGDKNSKLEDELKYLELLKGLDISREVGDVIKDEILSRNSLNHKITFFYKDGTGGHESAKKLMEYINSNPYFNELIAVYLDNAKDRIQKDTELIKQLDELIAQYAANLAAEKNQQNTGQITLSDEEQVDLPALFELKNNLIRDIEAKNVELKTRENAIKVINFGKPQKVKIPFFGKTLVLLPLLFVGGFFLWSILKYLNQKASELNQ